MLELERNLVVLRRWWWFLVLAAFIGGLVGYGITKAFVKQSYQATAVIAMSPAPQGPNGLSVTSLAASADAQLVSTVRTAQAARALLPAATRSSIAASTLAGKITGTPSIDGELLFVSVVWNDPGAAKTLANAVSRAFIGQERIRLHSRYVIIHGVFSSQEAHFAALTSTARGRSAATTWLQSQYADAASKLYQLDADARIQAALQGTSLQIAQPAVDTVKVGPKASINGLLGAALAFLVALIIAFVSTPFAQSEDGVTPPVFANVAK